MTPLRRPLPWLERISFPTSRWRRTAATLLRSSSGGNSRLCFTFHRHCRRRSLTSFVGHQYAYETKHEGRLGCRGGSALFELGFAFGQTGLQPVQGHLRSLEGGSDGGHTNAVRGALVLDLSPCIQGSGEAMSLMMPNERSGVDAGRASLFAFRRQWPGATHRGCWVDGV